MLYSLIKDCMKTMEKNVPQKLKEDLVCTNYSLMDNYHFGLGLWIRNKLLTSESELYKAFCSLGIGDKDDVSNLLLRLFYIYLVEKNSR